MKYLTATLCGLAVLAAVGCQSVPVVDDDGNPVLNPDGTPVVEVQPDEGAIVGTGGALAAALPFPFNLIAAGVVGSIPAVLAGRRRRDDDA